jgi:hypothetical protein
MQEWLDMEIDETLVRYPFLRRARDVIAERPPEDETLPRPEIIDQARYRMERAVKNASMDIQNVGGWPQYRDYANRTGGRGVLTEVVDFYSFFIAVQASSKDSFLRTCLARSEAQRSKVLFSRERIENQLAILHEATGLTLDLRSEDFYSLPFEAYLAFGSKHDLFEDGDWKLGNVLRIPFDHGVVYFTRNTIMDLFASVVNSLMVSGMRALRLQPIRADVLALVRQMGPMIPAKSKSRASYGYIEELLKHRVSDGRHRLSWLVLAPYLTNIKGMDENSALETIMAYVGDSKYRQFVRYQVKRAARQGLLPPSLSTLKSRHPDLYAILSHEAVIAR